MRGIAMKKIISVVLLLVSLSTFAQEDAWIYFADKPDAAFYLENPLEMLSQKALDRRARQGIALDGKDVPIHQAYTDAIMAANGITVMAKSKWLNAVHVRGSQADIENLAEFNFVATIDFADKFINLQGKFAHPQNLPVNKAQNGTTDFAYGNSANQIRMLNGHLLHEQDFTGAGMTIAVLDGGFPGVESLAPFERLKNNSQILGGYNYVERSHNFYTGGTHGTVVLSTMGGYSEGQLVGTAPDAFYYLFVTEDTGGENPVEESYWVEAAEKADSLGVDIINTSLGYFSYDDPSYSYTYEDIDGQTSFITRGANIAFSRGIFCVTSAGNSGNSDNPHISAPADAFNTLTVGAVDQNENRTVFSSIGPTYDQRIKPDVMAKGAAATVSNAQGQIATANGTSFSSPITAGLVACLWQALPELTNAELLQLIKSSADSYHNPDNQYGYGIPDFSLALQKGLGVSQQFIVYQEVDGNSVSLVFPYGVQNIDVLIYNGLGQLVMERRVGAEEASFSIEALASGIYYYRLKANNIAQKGKIIKQ